MTFPDVTWADVPVWVWIALGVLAWYVAAANVMRWYCARTLEPPEDGDVIGLILISPVLVVLMAAVCALFTVMWAIGDPVDPPWRWFRSR